MSRAKSPHGTYAAVRRHQAAKEGMCEACKAYQATERKRKALKAAGLDDEAKKIVDPPKVSIVFGGNVRIISAHDVDDALDKAGSRTDKPLDLRAELYKSLALIDLALEATVADEPSKLAPLSKRRSEILHELVEAGVEVKGQADDPMNEFMPSNVTSIAG